MATKTGCQKCKSERTVLKDGARYCLPCGHKQVPCQHTWTKWSLVPGESVGVSTPTRWKRRCRTCQATETQNAEAGFDAPELVAEVAKDRTCSWCHTRFASGQGFGPFFCTQTCASAHGAQVAKAVAPAALPLPKPKPTADKWVTREGEVVPVSQISDSHLVAIIKFHRKKIRERRPNFTDQQCDALARGQHVTMPRIYVEAATRGLLMVDGALAPVPMTGPTNYAAPTPPAGFAAPVPAGAFAVAAVRLADMVTPGVPDEPIRATDGRDRIIDLDDE